MFVQWLQTALPALPKPLLFGAAAAWYALMLALAVVGVFEPQAEFQYLAM